MKIRYAVLFALGAAIVSAAMTSAKQEAPVRPHRSWQLGWVPLSEGGHEWDARITVIDTEGACLYVVTSARGAQAGFSNPTVAISDSVAITAVPKTQLPKGAGCQ